jgi:hypothetical protein
MTKQMDMEHSRAKMDVCTKVIGLMTKSMELAKNRGKIVLLMKVILIME